jgi:hypothetical protein
MESLSNEVRVFQFDQYDLIDVTPYSVVEVNRGFGETLCFLLQMKKSAGPEN